MADQERRSAVAEAFVAKYSRDMSLGRLTERGEEVFTACDTHQYMEKTLPFTEQYIKDKVKQQLGHDGCRPTQQRRTDILREARRYFLRRSEIIESRLCIDLEWKGPDEWRRLVADSSLLTSPKPKDPSRSRWQLRAYRIARGKIGVPAPVGSSSGEESDETDEQQRTAFRTYRNVYIADEPADLEERIPDDGPSRGRSPEPRDDDAVRSPESCNESTYLDSQIDNSQEHSDLVPRYRHELEEHTARRSSSRHRSTSAATSFRVTGLDGAYEEDDIRSTSPFATHGPVIERQENSRTLSTSYRGRDIAVSPAGGNKGMPAGVITRQAPATPPSPQQSTMNTSQAQAQQQGNGLGAVLTNSLPPAGHQTDINYVWGVVQDLSDALQRNREQTAAIVERMHQMGAHRGLHISEDASGEHSQSNGESHGNASAEIASLRSQLHQSQAALAETQADASSLSSINDEYVTFLHGTMDKIRVYAHEHSKSIIAIHAHYNALLDQEREANMQLRIEHGNWQAGLGRATEFARLALKERSEEVHTLERKMREIHAENMVLRRLAGWEVHDIESDGEDAAGIRAEPKVRVEQAANAA